MMKEEILNTLFSNPTAEKRSSRSACYPDFCGNEQNDVLNILNLYSGVGGNRRDWEGNIHITAVEIVPEIAAIYRDLYPNDTVIVGDAHKYLLENYKSFDFIWSSPPCPTHSRTIFFNHIEPKFPDMKLYEEIIFCKYFVKVPWVVENVKSYYKPLIEPFETERHYFWSNFRITDIGGSKKVRNDAGYTLQKKMVERGIMINDFHNYKGDKRKLLNNCVEPELGRHILDLGLRRFAPPTPPLSLFEQPSKNSG